MIIKNTNRIKVVAKDGKHWLHMPDGTKIPGVVTTRVWDGPTDEIPYVIAKILCNIE